jgi:hypothetical protein
MLPDFPVGLTLDDGQRRRVIARDVAAAVFFYGFPDAVPFAECWRQQGVDGRAAVTGRLEDWVDELLGRAVIQPRLTLELVRRLGDGARTELATSYLSTVGFLPATPATWSSADDLIAVRPSEWRDREELIAMRALTTPPTPNLRTALRLMASKSRQLPSTLWALPISEWIFNWRVLLQEQLTERGPFTNAPELTGAR